MEGNKAGPASLFNISYTYLSCLLNDSSYLFMYVFLKCFFNEWNQVKGRDMTRTSSIYKVSK